MSSKPQASPSKKILAFPDARTAPHRAASVGSAELRTSDTAMADLVAAVGDDVISAMRNRAASPPASHEFAFDALARKTLDIVRSLPELAELSPELSMMRERARLLRALVADDPHPLKPRIVTAAETTVAQPLNRMRDQLAEMLDLAPFAVPAAIEEVRQFVAGFQMPEARSSAFARFERLVDAASRLSAGRDVIAPQKRELFIDSFLSHARSATRSRGFRRT
jgi:hypothetical protein